MKRITTLVFYLLAGTVAHSQAIDYSPVFRSMSSERSFRFSYENDFFSASDRDYTQGVYIEVIHPQLSRFILNRVTWRPRADSYRYGVALETNGYTPNNIDRKEIQANDRPYASTMLLKAFNTAQTNDKKTRITNTATIGVLGPWAGGKEIQSSIHRWIGYTKPLGWHNQVKNEPVLNYQVNYERGFLGDGSHLLITTQAMARAGTLSTKAAAGLSLMFGSFDNIYSTNTNRRKNFSIYLYDQPMANVVAYDATLQGGILNGTSPYTISASNINRLVFHNRVGLVINIKRVNLEYWQSFMTREFKTGIEPKTGGVQFGLRI